MSVETVLCPPHSSVMKTDLRRLRAAYTASASPAGPPPTMARSYITLAIVNHKHQIPKSKRTCLELGACGLEFFFSPTFCGEKREVLPTRHPLRPFLRRLLLVLVWPSLSRPASPPSPVRRRPP